MTNTAELRQRVAAAADNLDRIAADLSAALADVALLERLKSATDRVSRLTADQDKAIKEQDRAIAAAAKAEKASRFAGITDVSVTSSTQQHENLLRSGFTISYTKPTWDGRTTRGQKHSSDGFGTLPPEVLDYIIEKRPDLIPAKIMALAPELPRDAFRRYFVSLKRGFVVA